MPSMHLHARNHVFAFIAFASFVGIACSDDAATADPGGQNGDGGASSSGGSTSSGSSSGQSSGSPPTEPTCPALTGEPTWAKVDHKLDWKKADAAGPLDPTDNGASGLAYGNGTFVVLASTISHDRIRWATSTDGITWTDHQQKTTQTGSFTTGSRVHFTGKKFVFFGAHTSAGTFAYSSADGVAWEAHLVTTGAVNVSGFASDASGLTVSAGANGALWSSPDLVTWSNHGAGVTSYLNVAFGSGHWVATSNGAGTVYGGTDGSQWSPVTITPTPPGGFANLVFGRGTFLMAGSGGYLASPDGTTFAAAERSGDSALGKQSNGQSRFAGNRFVLFDVNYNDGKTTFAATTDGKKWDNFGTAETGSGTSTTAGPGVPVMVAFGQCHYVALAITSKDGGLHSSFVLLNAAASPAP